MPRPAATRNPTAKLPRPASAADPSPAGAEAVSVQAPIPQSPALLGHAPPAPDLELADPSVKIYIGDCREKLSALLPTHRNSVALVFADPPFNWNRAYDEWNDSMPRGDYLEFTYAWLDLCHQLLKPGGSLWVNIPDDTCAEIVMHLKGRGLAMNNWCIWHYRFGQNTNTRFISSKVHTLWFVKGGAVHTWRPERVLELSDRATTYFDPRTMDKKDGMPAGKRVPMDVWYGQYWGRVQGNNKERRGYHDNQLPEIYLDRVIKCSSDEGDLVLDPFLGSGTTAVMAHALKRRFIGTEFSEANARSSFERIQAGPTRAYDDVTGSAIFRPRNVGKKGLANVGRADEAKGLLDAASNLPQQAKRVRNGKKIV